jgi:cytoskeletal protein CcmA (bactofilin family)
MARNDPEQSVLSAATRVTGRVHGDGGLRVEGTVNGDVTVSGSLEIADGAAVEGDVSARTVHIAGKLLGDVAADGPISVAAGATVRGELRGTRIAIEPGATVAVRLETSFELENPAPRRAKSRK